MTPSEFPIMPEHPAKLMDIVSLFQEKGIKSAVIVAQASWASDLADAASVFYAERYGSLYTQTQNKPETGFGTLKIVCDDPEFNILVLVSFDVDSASVVFASKHHD